MVQRRKISDLEFLEQTIDDDDFFPVVDHTNNVTRRIKFQDLLLSNTFSGGTEAAPGISFTGDSDTGLARLSADEIAICANGVAIIKNNATNDVEFHPAQGKVRIYEADGSSYAELVVPNMGSNNAILTLPSSTGTLALTTDIPAGVVVLDSNNKVPANQIPDIAITEYKGAVANQTAMLAVTGEKGDWVVRNDDGKVYVITGTDPTSASDWTALSYPITTINLSYTDATRTIGNSAGNDAVLPFASETVAGLATFDGTDFNVASGDVTINTSRIQNLVGAMFSGNTETDIVVTYQSADGTIDLVVTNISGNAGTATALAAAVDIGGVSFDGQSSIDLPGVNQAGNQSTSGNAATATKLAAAVNIGGISFEGDAAIDLPGVNLQGNQDTTGNAATATALASAVLIGGVSFDGSANINLPGVNTTGNQDTTGNAATATTAGTADALSASVNIGGVAFDGSASINLPGVNATGNQDTTGNAATATVAASTSGNAATATQLLNSRFIGGVAFNGTANVVLPGVNATGNQDTSGTAAKATRLESTRSIGGVSFDGTADIDLPGVNTAGNQNTTGNAATATTATSADTLSTARNIGGVSFDASSDIDLPGVNTAGTQDTTGNAATATTASSANTLATARNIGGVSFDGSADISLPGVNTGGNQDTTGTAAFADELATARNIGGVSFDGSQSIDLPGVNTPGNQNTTGSAASAATCTGNAATATTLATARNIGGVSFDGSADISLPGVNTAGNQNTSGTATFATELTPGRRIGGVYFDGSSDITLPGVNATGNQDTSGNANTASALLNAQTITLTGAITGSGSFTGDAGTTISTAGSGFVDTSNSQSIGGVKTFTNDLYITGTRLYISGTTQDEKIMLQGTTNPYISFYEGTQNRRAHIQFKGSDDTLHLVNDQKNGRLELSDTLNFNVGTDAEFEIGTKGEIGVGGSNYGTSGQVLTSGGTGSAPTWQTLSTGNASTLDNLDSTQFLRSDADDTMSGNLTIDSSSSWDAGNGMLNVGGTGDGRIQTRHIWGKSHTSAGTDNIWLQYNNNGKHVQIGGVGNHTNNLYVHGEVYKGYIGSGSVHWHAGNDGAGSGLDADTLDGLNSGAWIRADANSNTDTNVKTRFGGQYITNQSGSSAVVQINGFSRIGALAMHRSANPTSGNGAPDADHEWLTNIGGVLRWGSNATTADNKIWHAGNDGAGSLLDADKLDNQEGSYYLDYNNFIRTPTIPTNNNQLTNGAGYITSFDITTQTDSKYLRSDAADTFTGDLTGGQGANIVLHPNIGQPGSTAYSSMSGYLIFDNDYSDSARGPNKVRLQNDGSWLSGLGISSNSTDIYTGGNFNFYKSVSTTVYTHLLSLSSDATLTSKGKVVIDGAAAPNTFAYLNIGQSGTGETRAIDIDGNWSANESKSISFTHGSNAADLVGQIQCVHQSPGSMIQFGRLYHSGNSSVYPLKLYSTSSTAAALSLNNNTVWHAGNDGSGSGLDADTLDGLHASSFLQAGSVDATTLDGIDSGSFLRSDANDTFTGNLTTSNNNHITFGPNSTWGSYLRVGGNGRTATGTEMASVVTTDGNLHIDAANSSNGTYINFYAGTGGVRFGTGASGTAAVMGTDGDLWKGSSDNTGSKYWHAANDGSGSGLDADTLDGIQGANFLRSDTSDTITGELNVTRNSGVTGSSAPSYSQANIELQTSDNHVPAIGFHRGGHSATTLYEYNGELYANAWTTRAQTGKLLSSGNIASYAILSTFEDGDRNLIIQNSSSSNGAGIEFRRNDGNFQGQLYFNATSAGFLNGSWASWDLEKILNGNLKIRRGSTSYVVPPINTANYGGTYNIPIITGDFLYPNTDSGSVTITGSTGQITTPNHGNSSQWNTAYGWGNHASAGYLTAGSVDAATLDGQNAAFYRNASNINAGTFPDRFSNTTRYNIQYIDGHADSNYDKLRVWNSGSYAIGMYAGQTHGWLNDYAMTFTMDNETDRGWKWRDDGDAVADGAMSLTTNGNLCVQNAIGIGQTGRYLQDVSGDYGSIQTGGNGRNNWEGYNINGRAVFMDNGSNTAGIYDDVNNEWWMLCRNNAEVELYHNGSQKLETLSNGIDVTGEVYASAWFRNRDSGEGLYNQSTGAHWYSDGDGIWNLTGNTQDQGTSLKFRGTHDGNVEGWIHANGSGEQGFLNNAGQWQLYIRNADGLSPNLYFSETANETWTGDPGSDIGKIEYHSNRFYIVAGSNSTEIVQFRRSNANKAVIDNSGNFTAQGNVTAYSDIKFKDDIQVIPNALDKVQQLRGVTYVRNDHEEDQERQAGVIAQEVEKVFPEVVRDRENGKTVAYGNMVGLLIEAVKELRAEVGDLKAEVARLQSEKS